MTKVQQKPIEIFCGTGGVGKTTLAAARALDLAKKGSKVLLITIDPAKRLKQILHLNEEEAGSIQKINSQIFSDCTTNDPFSFDALLMSPNKTIKRIASENNASQEFENNIIKILSRPYGGMNEIMSIVEVQYQLEKNIYDVIILDTPPGKHFVDFLQSTQKIKNFFDKSFIEIFKYLGKSFSKGEEKKSPSLVKMLVSSGAKKLLSYLEKVTGGDFVEEFVSAIASIYKSKDSFLRALNFQEDLKKSHFSNWFLVTSVEQYKISEAKKLHNKVESLMHSDNYLAINKCLTPYLNAWELTENSQLYPLKETMLQRENRLKEFAGSNFANILEFPEVLSPAPDQHVSELSATWENY